MLLYMVIARLIKACMVPFLIAGHNYSRLRLLVLMFQNLLTNYMITNTKQQVILYGKAEVKILCIVCYYVSLGIFILLSLTYFEVTQDAQLEALMDYTECNLPGFHPSEVEGDECGDSGIPFVRLRPYYVLSAIGIFQLIFIPLVILVFTVRCTCKFRCRRRRQTETSEVVITN